MTGKRVFDVLVGLSLTVVAVPLVLVLVVPLALTFRGRPFFVQDRVGFGGRRFRMVKLRTLRPEVAPYLLKGDLPPAASPPLARQLRRLHLDELPQLLLVVLGRLSLVGPRPRMPDHVEPVEASYGHLRVQVPQGCTGLWQIGQHTGGLPSEAPEYDLFYVEHASLRLDLWILWRTAVQMLGVGSPVGLSDIPRWTVGATWSAGPCPVGGAHAGTRQAA